MGVLLLSDSIGALSTHLSDTCMSFVATRTAMSLCAYMYMYMYQYVDIGGVAKKGVHELVLQ